MNSNAARGFWAFAFVVLILAIVAIVVYAIIESNGNTGGTSTPQGTLTGTVQAQNINAVFTCDGGKTINATFMNAATATTTGNAVMLVLSDGRQMTLPQVISADGARYANSDESFVFWNVGNGATITENGSTTYNNCVTSTQ